MDDPFQPEFCLRDPAIAFAPMSGIEAPADLTDMLFTNPTHTLETSEEASSNDQFHPYDLFLYGELTDPEMLQRALQSKYPPVLQLGSLQGYKQKMWSVFPAIVPDVVAAPPGLSPTPASTSNDPQIKLEDDIRDEEEEVTTTMSIRTRSTTMTPTPIPRSQATIAPVKIDSPRVMGYYIHICTAEQHRRLRDLIPVTFDIVPASILVDMTPQYTAFPNITARSPSEILEFVVEGYTYVWTGPMDWLDEGTFNLHIFKIHMESRQVADILAEYCEKRPEKRILDEDGTLTCF